MGRTKGSKNKTKEMAPEKYLALSKDEKEKVKDNHSQALQAEDQKLKLSKKVTKEKLMVVGKKIILKKLMSDGRVYSEYMGNDKSNPDLYTKVKDEQMKV